MRLHRGGVALALCAILAGCTDGGAGSVAEENAEENTGAPEAAAGPTLLEVMAGLQGDMDRLHHALWAGNMDSVAVAARAVADHPEVGPQERTRVLGILGDRGPAFVALDRAVHDAGVTLAEHAGAGDVPGTLEALARLQEGCVACHTEFRAPLRMAGR